MRGRDQDWTSNKAVDSRLNKRKSSFAGELTKNATHPLGTSFRSFGAFQMVWKINLILLCSRGCFAPFSNCMKKFGGKNLERAGSVRGQMILIHLSLMRSGVFVDCGERAAFFYSLTNCRFLKGIEFLSHFLCIHSLTASFRNSTRTLLHRSSCPQFPRFFYIRPPTRTVWNRKFKYMLMNWMATFGCAEAEEKAAFKNFCNILQRIIIIPSSSSFLSCCPCLIVICEQ